MYDYTFYTDGGCIVNPGGPGGLGVVGINHMTGEVRTYSKGFVSTTNNRMEITALLCALSFTPDNSRIQILSDSSLAINCAQGKWARKSNTDLWKKYDELKGNRKIDFVWVKGHDGTIYNEICDALASDAIMEGPWIKDKGYEEAKTELSFPEGKKSHISDADIIIPEGICGEALAGGAPVSGLNDACSEMIATVYNLPIRSYSFLSKIKSGGRDAVSSMKAKDIAGKASDPEAYEETIRKYIDNERRVTECMKWNARGLTLKDAVWKVLIDMNEASKYEH